MDISFVPTIADAIKGYYEQEELIELCDLYGIHLDFDGMIPAYMRLARDLYEQINDHNVRRFLTSIVLSLLNRAREGAAKSKWERQEYHRAMVENLTQIKDQIEAIPLPTQESSAEHLLLTVEEVASLFRTGSKTVITLLESGRLAGLKIGGEWKIGIQAVIDFLGRETREQGMEILASNLKDPKVWARELSKFPDFEQEFSNTEYQQGTMGAFIKQGIMELKSEKNKAITPPATGPSGFRDVFICHASEDKKHIVEPLVHALDGEGVSYWYDQAEIAWGDSLTNKVNQGLKISRYVLVVLTKEFINKRWPRRELDSALNIEANSGAVKILPLLCGTTAERQEIINELPLLNDKYYVVWDRSPDNIIKELRKRLKAGDM